MKGLHFMFICFVTYFIPFGALNKAYKYQQTTLLVQDSLGSPIANATLNNKTQSYTLLFDHEGKLQLGNRPLYPTDEIQITCVGYKLQLLSGKQLLSSKAITLQQEVIGLNEVTVKNEPEELVFKTAASLPFPLYYHATATDGKATYTIGGLSGNKYCTQALKYTPQTNSWSLLAHNLKPAIQSTASYVPATNKIYVIGGLTSLINWVYFDKVESIDVNTGEVAILPIKNPMPSAYGSAAVWNNKIYIFGGGVDQNYMVAAKATNALYEFDPQTLMFTKLPNMPEKLQCTGAILNGILYTFGGYEQQGNHVSKNIYAYDISKKDWQLIGKLPQGISANNISVYHNLIFLTGDYSNLKFTGFFNTQTRKFVQCNSNLVGRKHSSAVALYDHLMVVGGDNGMQAAPGQPIGLTNVQVADLKDILTKEQ